MRNGKKKNNILENFILAFVIFNDHIIVFPYLEPDLQHVWDMNPASNFDAGNAQLLML